MPDRTDWRYQPDGQERYDPRRQGSTSTSEQLQTITASAVISAALSYEALQTLTASAVINISGGIVTHKAIRLFDDSAINFFDDRIIQFKD